MFNFFNSFKCHNSHTLEPMSFSCIFMSQQKFEKFNFMFTNIMTIVLKRKPKHIWVNRYNRHLLRCCNTNINIHFIVDAHSCVVYIISEPHSILFHIRQTIANSLISLHYKNIQNDVLCMMCPTS